MSARSGGGAGGGTPASAFLAFDHGTRRIGVASGNTVTRTATPLATLRADDAGRLSAQLQQLIVEWRPDALVVGIPCQPDGTPHEATRRAERFARRLEQFRLPVHRVDERYSSVEAESRGASDVDAAAAAVILEQFLNELPAAA